MRHPPGSSGSIYCDMKLLFDTKHLQITKMEGSISCSDEINTTTSTSCPGVAMVTSPCAACKILRRRCIVDKCLLAPYFPPNDPLRFTTAHRVFGASNIIKFLQEVPEAQRADAVSSMVYEANARLRDPVYGCAGAICHLQKQINELQEQLAKAQAEIINIQCQNANLMTLICTMEFSQSSQTIVPNSRQSFDHFASSPCSDLSDMGLLDENDLGLLYEQSLWT